MFGFAGYAEIWSKSHENWGRYLILGLQIAIPTNSVHDAPLWSYAINKISP